MEEITIKLPTTELECAKKLHKLMVMRKELGNDLSEVFRLGLYLLNDYMFKQIEQERITTGVYDRVAKSR